MREKRPRRPRSTSQMSPARRQRLRLLRDLHIGCRLSFTRCTCRRALVFFVKNLCNSAENLLKCIPNCVERYYYTPTGTGGTCRSTMRGCCPMAAGRRVAPGVCAALLAAAMLLSPAPVRADCSPQDLANAVESAFNAFASSQCASASSTGVGAGIATALTGALFALSAGGDQSSVGDFCSAISNALNTLGDIQSDANSAQTIVGSSSALSSIASFVSDAAGVGLDPLNIAACACTVEENLEQAGSELAGCACDIAATFLGSTCNCTPPPSGTADCASTLADCGSGQNADPVCGTGLGPNGISPIITTSSGTSPPVVQINGPTGSTVTQYDSSGPCAASWSCFCPKPMTLIQVCDTPLDYNCSDKIFACVCPKTTHPDPSGKLVNGISVCLCDTSKQPANFTPNSFEPMCPPCPTGEVQASATGKCVAACAKNEVMTPDGKCCDPNKVTFCGQCCPPGSTPDPARGTCTTPGQIQ